MRTGQAWPKSGNLKAWVLQADIQAVQLISSGAILYSIVAQKITLPEIKTKTTLQATRPVLPGSNQ